MAVRVVLVDIYFIRDILTGSWNKSFWEGAAHEPDINRNRCEPIVDSIQVPSPAGITLIDICDYRTLKIWLKEDSPYISHGLMLV